MRCGKAATEAVSEHGVFQVAKVLRLDYTKLKRMTQAGAAAAQPTLPPRFVELALPPAPRAGAECVIVRRSTRQDAHPLEGCDAAGPGRTQPGVVGPV